MLHSLVLAVSLASRLAAPTSEHWIGEVSLTAGTGARVGSGVMLVSRTLDPANARITERIVRVETARSPVEYNVVWTFDGLGATFEEKSGAYKGTARFRGAPFAFTSFSGTATVADGGLTVKEKGRFSKTTMTFSREVSGPDGALQVRREEKYRPISAETFELLRKSLLPSGSGQ